MVWNGVVGIIGAGNMAGALVRGLLAKGTVTPDRCIVTNRSNDARLERFGRDWGVGTTRDKARLVRDAGIIVLAVKPASVPDVLREIAPHLNGRHLVISMAAGVSLDTIEADLGSAAVVRAMPNTSTAVGASATALCLGRHAEDRHLDAARQIFEAVGRVVLVPERLFDAVTGLSGTGPAYVYYLAEAMLEAAEREGLDREVALNLVSQTVLGAGKMLVETGEDPAVLRAQVTSPNGTTVAGIAALDEGGFRSTVGRAVDRATRRAEELRAQPVRTR